MGVYINAHVRIRQFTGITFRRFQALFSSGPLAASRLAVTIASPLNLKNWDPPIRFLAIGFALLLLNHSSFGQTASSLDQLDQRISQARHQKAIESGSLVVDGTTQALLNRIAIRISHSSYFTGYSFPSRVFYMQDSAPNAFSNGGGEVYVTTGLVQAVHSNEGILAFAIGHEMAHNRLQHAARDYWRRVQYETEYRRLRMQDSRAALAYQVTWYITDKKIRRNEEHAADQLGLLAAAEAGYHPDYGILAARVLRLSIPDSSKFLTFFYSDHPRWITREEHTEKNYAEALAIFDRNWPKIETSPGGSPPTLAVVSRVQVVKNRSGITSSTEVQVRHLRNQRAVLSALVVDEGGTPRTVFTREFAGDQTTPELVSFEIPKQDYTPKKASLMIQIRAGDEVLYGSGPIGLRSSRKGKSKTKSGVDSMSRAAETEIAKVDPNLRAEEESSLTPTESLNLHQLKTDVNTKSAEGTPSTPAPGDQTGRNNIKVATAGYTWQPPAGGHVFTIQEPPMCEVEVKSNLIGAAVDVDGTPVGTTPVTIRFRPSSFGFTIHVTREGYLPWYVQSVAISGRQEFEADLHAVPASKEPLAVQ